MDPTETFTRRDAMAAEHTEQQTDSQRRQASELSLRRSRPPAEIPGYEFQEFLGSGAYGEVWVAIDRNTGRRVAIKFYTHRGGLDWRLLSREVEKLVLLSADRYVVQVLDVGWDATPPHYVMEFIENGSLDEYLKQHGPLPVGEAVDMFRGVATGLLHAHNKGVLHCDVKPANVLLDQDHKPRLADFGQSRLSHEQKPALGTMFYMAPEQADLEAIPDARWDVYALGVLLYLMLTGELPYRNDTTIAQINLATGLDDRLAAYRNAIREMPPPTLHRNVPGVDRALADIVDRCLAVNPQRRFPNVQTVLEALADRDAARARFPLLTLGILGPALLLAVMGFFGWRGYTRAMRDSERGMTAKVEEANKFAVQFVASGVAHELERYYRGVENPARSGSFIRLVERTVNNEELADMLAQLKELDRSQEVAGKLPADEQARLAELETLREKFAAHPERQELQRYVDNLLGDNRKPAAASWVVTDAQGTHVASAFPTQPARSPIGRNFAWRSYFNGEDADRPEGWHTPEGYALADTHLSSVFLSTATNTWKVAISTPIYKTIDGPDGEDERVFLGILYLTVEMGGFLREFEGTDDRYAVLVDGREGPYKGVILQHPLFEEVLEKDAKLPERFSRYRVSLDDKVVGDVDWNLHYADPLGQDEAGQKYNRPWIMAKAPVKLRRGPADAAGQTSPVNTGWVVLVQEDSDNALETVHTLGNRLVREGLTALSVVGITIVALWFFVVRSSAGSGAFQSRNAAGNSSSASRSERPTVPHRK